MNEILKYYDFDNPKTEFIRHSENKVYKLITEDKDYILRIHEPLEGTSFNINKRHFSDVEYIQGEMDLLAALSNQEDFSIQTPIKNRDGDFVTKLADGRICTVLTWINGNTVSDIEMNEEVAFKLGTTLGKMHQHFEGIEPNIKLMDKSSLHLKRCYYDYEMIEYMKDEFLDAYRLNHINLHYLELIHQVLDVVKSTMKTLDGDLKMTSIVHSDLGLSNLIENEGVISPIDFSLSGYGFYHMDISSLCANFRDKTYRREVIKGYEKQTNVKVATDVVEVFFAFGVILYICTQHNRVYKEEWFANALARWENTIWRPVVANERYLV